MKKLHVALIAFVLSLLCLGTPRQARAAMENRAVTVQRGDTLTGIAKTECRNAFLYKEITSPTRVIVNRDMIYAGETLLVPCAAKSVAVRPQVENDGVENIQLPLTTRHLDALMSISPSAPLTAATEPMDVPTFPVLAPPAPAKPPMETVSELSHPIPAGRRSYRISVEGVTPGIFPAYLLFNRDSAGNWKRKRTFVEVKQDGDSLSVYLPLERIPPSGSEIDFDPGGSASFMRISGEAMKTAEPVEDAWATPPFLRSKKAYAALDEEFPAHRSKALLVAMKGLRIATPFALAIPTGAPGEASVAAYFIFNQFRGREEKKVQVTREAKQVNDLQLQIVQLKQDNINLHQANDNLHLLVIQLLQQRTQSQ